MERNNLSYLLTFERSIPDIKIPKSYLTQKGMVNIKVNENLQGIANRTTHMFNMSLFRINSKN